jgi:uncharacterized repeat protein (TIGR04138 family)
VDLPAIAQRDGRFDVEAFRLVTAGLRRGIELAGKSGAAGEARHLAADELVEGVCDLAVERYGTLADLVLAGWRLRTGAEIGDIVWRLIAAGVLRASPGDDPAQFTSLGELGPRLRRAAVRRATGDPDTDAKTGS